MSFYIKWSNLNTGQATLLGNCGELQGKVHSIPEPLWCEEIKEVEKLLQVVLKRCSREQQFVLQTIVVQDPEKLQNKKVPF